MGWLDFLNRFLSPKDSYARLEAWVVKRHGRRPRAYEARTVLERLYHAERARGVEEKWLRGLRAYIEKGHYQGLVRDDA